MGLSEMNAVERPRERARRFCPWLWRGAAVAVALFGLVVLAMIAGLYWSEPLLTIEHPPVKADVIVVLGGEPAYRPPRALELYEQQLAPTIVVSGHGEADEIGSWFAAKGVARSAIRTEPKSISTHQNAEFTVPLLRVQNARRVIIVTSWFHSRRALACFKKAAPEMEFVSLPTVIDRPTAHWPSRYERVSVMREYVKLLGYWVRYGVYSF